MLPWVKAIWGGAILAMFVLSAIAVAAQKHLLEEFGRWWLLLWVAAASTFFLWAASAVANATAHIDPLRDDNGFAIGFLAGWLMVLGYLSKLPWDAAREKWFEAFKPMAEAKADTADS